MNTQELAGRTGATENVRPWISPELRRMHAGSAEAGANPVNPEGPFAKGS